MGRHIYTFRNLCIEDRTLELDDGATRIFLNTKGTRDDVDDSDRAFLNYVNGVVSEDSLVQEIDEEIHRIKIEERGKVGHMFLADKIAEERFYAAKEGREEGRMEGHREGMLDMARSLLMLNVPVEVIEKSSGLTRAEILAL